MVVRPDWAGGAGVAPHTPISTPPPPKPNLRQIIGGYYNSPPPPPSIAAPVHNTPVNNNWSSAPTWSPANSYVAPVANYQYQYSPPANPQLPVDNWGAAGAGAGGTVVTGATGGAQAAQAAPVDPGPTPGGRRWYEALGKDAKAAEDAKYLAGDSDYTDQIAQYTKALDDYVARTSKNITGFKEDWKTADANTKRNQGMTLDALGEDFGARGLAYSQGEGLMGTEMNRTNQRFTEALANLLLGRDRNIDSANNDLTDYRGENTVGRQNARRSALQRMAQKQDLVDTSALL